MNPNSQTGRAAALLERDAAMLQAAAPGFAPLIAEVATMLHAARAAGRKVSVCGNRVSGAIVAAAGLDYGVYLPPGHAGDLLFVVMPDLPADDLDGVIFAARERGLVVIALLAPVASRLAALADICLPVQASDTSAIRVVMVATMQAIGMLAA